HRALSEHKTLSISWSHYRLSINSFSQLGFDVSVTFVDAKGMKYQYFDLIKDGYSVDIKDACRVVIRKGRYLQTVTCQE
ncbi:hypothetical protein FSF25_025465, partial [Escherichia coli]|nr:hypothetical protein [Escherichia coli]